MTRSLVRLMLAAGLLLAVGTLAQAQSTNSSLLGAVTDSGGGVIPGATVVVKNNATSVTTNTVTNSSGAFSVPALEAGKYSVTVSLSGFKTAVFNDVTLLALVPATLKVTLEVGTLSETVTVNGGADLVQTQSPAISTTIQVDQINKLPSVTRNALNYITFLPGVDTIGANRDSTISGLAQGAINITIDGVNVQDNYLRSSDGFFARTTPRQDAVEQVTVTSATQGAASAGQGAVQIAFVTRSGTNQFKGTGYHFFRHPALNTNYWFNDVNKLEKNRVILNQYGGSEGGPIVLPGAYDGRGKAFFFGNYEEFRHPTQSTQVRTFFQPQAELGVLRYSTTGGTIERNVLQIAAAAGHTSTIDPTVASILAVIRDSTTTTGVVSNVGDLNTQQYRFQTPARLLDQQLTTKVDYNFNSQHRLTGTYAWQKVIRDPDFLNEADPLFPGLPNYSYYTSWRPTTSFGLRSTISSSMVNEVKFGAAWGPGSFGLRNITPESFANQGGFDLNLPLVDDATVSNNPSERNGYNWDLTDTLNWQRGHHSISLGASFSQFTSYVDSRLVVPTIDFGVDQNNDPANAIFNTTNFPGASTGNLTTARSLYALLTGRVTSISGDARLDPNGVYRYLGLRRQAGRLNEMGLFAQDSWRLASNVTVNAGLRWELQLPFYALNDVYSKGTIDDICGISGRGNGPGGRECRLFDPTASGGKLPAFTEYQRQDAGYATDWNNLAPNVGIAWQPNAQGGVLRSLLGDPAQATIRAGFSVAYNRNGLSDLMTPFANNQGSTITTTRNATNGNLVLPGQSWPVLLRERDRLGPPSFPETPAYPVLSTIATRMDVLHPDLEVAYSRSVSVGLQRAVSKDMAVEVRYVGTRNLKGWTTENWNEINIYENGFLDEFKRAQANLRANIAANRGATFAYMGPGTGTAPLPTYLAYFSGRTDASNTAAYSSTNWANSAWTGHLGEYEPDPLDAANDLHANQTLRNSAITAGLPRNFFRMNPDVASGNVTVSASGSYYHSMQTELRRRLSRGFFLNANYTLAKRYGTSLPTLHQERVFVRSTATPRHALKMSWTYEVPFGRGRRYGANVHPILHALAGDWEFSGASRIQSGRLLSFSNARLVGMTGDELQAMFKVRVDSATGTPIVRMLPDDVILNTRRAYDTDPTSAIGYGSLGVPEGKYIAPASTPGCVRVYATDCGEARNIFLTGPVFSRVDMSFKKTFALQGRLNAQLQFDVFNVFNAINYTPVANPGSGATIFQVTSGYQDSDNTFDPGGRLGQISWRINW
jgi:hypothetical protein